VLIASGLLILFWDIPVLGHVQVPADIVLNDPVMQAVVPAGFERPQNPLLGDHVYQFYVWHYLAAQAMHRGAIPLWNPYILAGQPLVANAQSALFYPINLLLFWLSPGVVASLRVAFNILISGLFTFLFSRELQISQRGAVLAGMAFAFSGAVMVGPGHAYASSLAWMPLIFWSGEKLLNGRNPLRWGPMVSVGCGLSILGGHPETTFHILVTASLYFIGRVCLLQASGLRKLAMLAFLALCMLLGFALGAVQWVPFGDLLRQSSPSTSTRSRSLLAESVFYTWEWWPNATTLATLLYPAFFGHPADYNYAWPFRNFQNYLEQSMYFGLAPFALAVGTVLSRARKRSSVLILAVLAVVAICIALRAPGFEAINHLPVFDRTNNTRFKWIFTFLGAVLAGFGFDELEHSIDSIPAENKHIATVLAWVSVCVLGVFGVISIYRLAADAHLGIPTHPLFDLYSRTVFAINRPRIAVSVAAAWAILLLYLVCRRSSRAKALVWPVLMSVTFVELITMAWGYNTTVPPGIIFPEIKLSKWLSQDHSVYRVLSIPPTFWPNYPAVYGVYEVGGYDLPVLKRYADVYAAQGGQGYRQAWAPDWPLVDWMNVKYVVSPDTLTLDKLELVMDEGGYKLYRNRNALPRAYLVYNIDVIPDDQAVLELLVSGAFDFRRTAIVQKELPTNQAVALASPHPAVLPQNHVEIREFDFNTVGLYADTEAAGMLVMSDVYAPGWEVYVDGRRQDLYRANYAFRGVFVPAGQHVVVFQYEPWGVRLGAWLSALGAVVIATGLGVSIKRRLTLYGPP
jgi:hypothetical protein